MIAKGAAADAAGEQRVSSTDGVVLTVHDLGGNGPPVLLCHPTGFHGRVWAPVTAQLADVARLWSVDLRGHGDSGLPDSGSLRWDGFGDDVLATVDHLDLAPGPGRAPLVGVGHSMGGAALLLAEQARPGLFAALWCFEPIVFPGAPGGSSGESPGNPMAAAARRRKAVFPDREAALFNYASKPPLGALAPEALEAYVSHGFRDRPDGSVELKCDPETEARVFEQGGASGAFDGLGAVACPVVVARGGDGGYPAQVAPRVAEALPDGRLRELSDLTHFGPMEDPTTIAASVRTLL